MLSNYEVHLKNRHAKGSANASTVGHHPPAPQVLLAPSFINLFVYLIIVVAHLLVFIAMSVFLGCLALILWI